MTKISITASRETFVVEPDEAFAPAPAGNPFEGLVRPAQQRAANDSAPGRAPADSPPNGGRASDAPAEPESPALSISRDRRLAAAVIGPRLRTARELSGFTQVELSEKLGYRNTSQLNLWESGQRVITTHALVQSSTVLGVSLDYLCGLCSEPERDPGAARRRAYLGAVRAQIERLSEEIVGSFEVADRLCGPDAENFRVLVRAADTLAEAIQTLQRLNGGRFDDLRGGSPVVAACHAAQEAVLVGKAALRVHDAAHGDLMKRLAVIGRGGVVDEV